MSNPAARDFTIPSFGRTPLMHCRHDVGNYVDLFQGLFEVFYEAGGVQGPVVVMPEGTVG